MLRHMARVETSTIRMEKRDTLRDDRDTPSVYVGETSRSIKERALEHWKDYFVFKVVSQFRDALSRQVAEAIRIMLRQNTLNSKNGYIGCFLVIL